MQVMYKLRYPDGHWVVIWEDGTVDGVPDGTLIINRAPVVFYYLQEQSRRRDCAARSDIAGSSLQGK